MSLRISTHDRPQFHPCLLRVTLGLTNHLISRVGLLIPNVFLPIPGLVRLTDADLDFGDAFVRKAA
eukprot:1844327-Alexandrium_andersonii.AAC.1